MTPAMPTIRHIEQYKAQFMVMVAEDREGYYVHAFHIQTLDPVLLEARGFPSIDHGIQAARRAVDREIKKIV